MIQNGPTRILCVADVRGMSDTPMTSKKKYAGLINYTIQETLSL